MDLSGLVSSFATGTYVVTRTTHAAPIRGRAQNGTTSTFTITASISPVTGDDLKRLPEGRRTNETRAVYTTTMLTVGGEGQAYEADTINFDGEDWEVQAVATWHDPVSGNTAYRCIAQASR